VEKRPVDEVKNCRGFPFVPFREVCADAGQPGEGSELGWDVMGERLLADGDADLACG
jgi:hypothetical protein